MSLGWGSFARCQQMELSKIQRPAKQSLAWRASDSGLFFVWFGRPTTRGHFVQGAINTGVAEYWDDVTLLMHRKRGSSVS